LQVGVVDLKCPECCEELEKLFPLLYLCHKCNERFMIFNSKEMELVLNMRFSDDLNFECQKIFDKIKKDDFQ